MHQTPSPHGRRSVHKRNEEVSSPTVRSRAMEKEELSGLNDRLANYIDRMRYLESQNSKLTAEIYATRDNKSREVDNVKVLYENELSDARRMVDESARGKNLLQIENKKLAESLDDLKQKLEKEKKARIRAEDERDRFERRVREKESLFTIISKEKKQLEDRVKELEADLLRLKNDLDKQKKITEDEIIRRVSAENMLQTCKEDLVFKQQTHEEEMRNARSSIESYRLSLSEVDGADNDFSSGLIMEKLQELRDEFEEEAEKAKNDLEASYQTKFEEMRRSSAKDRGQLSRAIEKKNEMKSELDRLSSDYNLMEAKCLQLENRVKEIERLRLLDNEDFQQRLQSKDDRVRSLEDDLFNLQKEYEILLGIKIALDVEIAAYRKLLEGEEERLHIPSPSSSERSGSRLGKRRYEEEVQEVEQMTAGPIEFDQFDSEGKFIRVKNVSDEDVPIGGWALRREVDGNTEDVTQYRFSPKFVLKSGKTVTVWSQSSGVKQKAPTDILFKNGDWKLGKTIITTLDRWSAQDSSSETMAQQTVKHTGPSSPRRARRNRSGVDKESCTVM